MQLRGRYAIITGASQGLGAVIAEQYVREGASVMLCGRDSAALERAAQATAAFKVDEGQIIAAQTANVAVPAEVDALVDAALARFPRVDVLVNNAGVYGPMGAIEECDWAEWVDAISINLMGTVYPCRRLAPHMRAHGYGKIVNLSGGGATAPLPRLSAYAASKAAVVRFTETLALELKGTRIDVNAVAPGALNTRMMDQLIAAGPEKVGAAFFARMRKVAEGGGTPLEKGAELCVYLASAQSDGVTGRLLSAVWDPWPTLQNRVADLDATDIYTLRRIVPEDRGRKWEA